MNCRRCESQLEADELRCPVCSLVAPPSAAPQGAATMKVRRCETCGAAMARWSAETQAVRCVFCDGQAKLQELVDPMEQTEAWVPFRVDAHDARAAVKRWLGGRGFFAPGDLASSNRGSLYRVVVHGQDGARVLGDPPISLARESLVLLGIIVLWLGFIALLGVLALR